MQVKHSGADSAAQDVEVESQQFNVFDAKRSCRGFRKVNQSSKLKNDSFLSPSHCKKTLIKLNLHKGKIRKSRFRVMFWLYAVAGQMMTSKQKFIYKVIPKE
jgi:hypothetical protein